MEIKMDKVQSLFHSYIMDGTSSSVLFCGTIKEAFNSFSSSNNVSLNCVLLIFLSTKYCLSSDKNNYFF